MSEPARLMIGTAVKSLEDRRDQAILAVTSRENALNVLLNKLKQFEQIKASDKSVKTDLSWLDMLQSLDIFYSRASMYLG